MTNTMMRERFIPLQLPKNFNFPELRLRKTLAKNCQEPCQELCQEPCQEFRRQPVASTRPELPNRDAAAGQATVPEFHQLNVKAWLIRRIQIALITRYALAFSPVSRLELDPAMPVP
jgi:hypothetical protein